MYRFYKADVPAQLKSGPKTVSLVKGTTFKLEGDEVILDGVIYPVKPSMLAELKTRSTTVKPKKEYKTKDEFLDLHGIDIADTFARRLARVKFGKTVQIKHGFKDGKAFAWFPYRLSVGEVRVTLSFNMNVFALSVWSSQTVKIDDTEDWELLKQFAKKFVSWLKAKYQLSFSKRQYRTSTLANVRFVDGSVTSGRVRSYILNWSQ